MIKIEHITKTYQTLAEIRQIDVENWSDETKQEMETEVDEVIKWLYMIRVAYYFHYSLPTEEINVY